MAEQLVNGEYYPAAASYPLHWQFLSRKGNSSFNQPATSIFTDVTAN